MKSSSNFQNPKSENKSENILDNEIPKIKNIKENQDDLDQNKKLRTKRSSSVKETNSINTYVPVPAEELKNIGLVYTTTNGGLERLGIGSEMNPYTIKIANEGVTTERIKDNAITTDKIQRGMHNTILMTDKEGYVKWASSNESGAIMGPTESGMLQKTGNGTEKDPYTLGITPSKNFGILTTDENGNVNWDLLKGDVDMSPGSGHINVKALDGRPLSKTPPSEGALLQWDGDEWISKNREEIAVPKGSIIMWSGNYSTIPKGWTLCNGNNETPDLQERFIVGATYTGEKYNVRSTGGEEMVTLTIEQMPNHSHKPQIQQSNIFYTYPGNVGDRYWRVNSTDRGSTRDGHNTSKEGSGQPHENRPPYFALYFIMKII